MPHAFSSVACAQDVMVNEISGEQRDPDDLECLVSEPAVRSLKPDGRACGSSGAPERLVTLGP